MDYKKPDKFININDFDAIISIGNKCPTATTLRALNIYKESFPFDYIPSTPALILKYLKDTTDFYPQKNVAITKDNVWFGHFNLSSQYDTTIETFKRRFDRLFELLKNKRKCLFVYTTEADIYNEFGNRYNKNYIELCKITEYIKDTYQYEDFMILAIHTNKTFEDTKNIINYTINVNEKYMSDDMSTHIPEVTNLYRPTLKKLLKEIFKL